MSILNTRLFSAGLVAAQFFLIILICIRALAVTPGTSVWPTVLLVAIACVLAIAAALSLQVRNFSVMPEPVEQGKLITSGPYRYIRHPMYTAVLTGCAGMLALNFTLLSGALLVALYAVLLLKIHREELLLKAAYSGYDEYRKHTGMLLPKFSGK